MNFLVVRLPEINEEGLDVVDVDDCLLTVIVLNGQAVLIVGDVGYVCQQQLKSWQHRNVIHDDQVSVVHKHEIIGVDFIECLVSSLLS